MFFMAGGRKARHLQFLTVNINSSVASNQTLPCNTETGSESLIGTTSAAEIQSKIDFFCSQYSWESSSMHTPSL